MTFIPKLKLSLPTKIVLCTLLGLGVSYVPTLIVLRQIANNK